MKHAKHRIAKSIFEYDDYRKYLRDVYTFLHGQDQKFSFRYFSRQAGFRSTNIFKLVMDGERNIGPRSISKFCKALKLVEEEAEFFRHLVRFNQASSAEEKHRHARELVRSKSFRRIFPLKESQYNYFSHWYFIPVREMISLPGFREDPEWIARRISPRITPDKAKQAIQELLKLELIRRDQATKKLTQTERDVESPRDNFFSASLAKTHSDLIKLGAEAIGRVARDKREIMSISVPMSALAVEKIKELTRKFRDEVLESVAEGTHDSVFQLNIQLFPVVELTDSNEGEK